MNRISLLISLLLLSCSSPPDPERSHRNDPSESLSWLVETHTRELNEAGMGAEAISRIRAQGIRAVWTVKTQPPENWPPALVDYHDLIAPYQDHLTGVYETDGSIFYNIPMKDP